MEDSRNAKTVSAATTRILIYLVEELGDARLRAAQLKRYVQQATDLIEKSPHKDHFFEVAAQLIHGIPQALLKLEKALDASAMAAARLDYEEIRQGLRPEKSDELEDVMEDTRLRYLNRRSTEDVMHKSAKMKFRVWTGPVDVKSAAKRLQQAGIDAHDGTEHVYGTIDANDEREAAEMINEAVGFKLIEPRDLANPRMVDFRRASGEPMTPKDAAAQLLQLATAAEETGQVPVRSLLAMIASLEQDQQSGPELVQKAAGVFRAASKTILEDPTPSRRKLAGLLRRILADTAQPTLAAAPIFTQAGSREEVMDGFKKENPDLTEDQLKEIADQWEANKDVVKDKTAAEDKDEDKDSEKGKPFPGAAPPFGKDKEASAGEIPIPRLNRVIDAIEKEAKNLSGSWETYKRDPQRYAPQLENVNYAAIQLGSHSRVILRSLGMTRMMTASDWEARELKDMEALLKGKGYDPKDAKKLQGEGMGTYELEDRLKKPSDLERTHGLKKEAATRYGRGVTAEALSKVARDISKFTTYDKILDHAEFNVVSLAGEVLEDYLNTLHKRIERDEHRHGGSWTYGTPDKSGDTWSIRVYSQSSYAEAAESLEPNLSIRVEFGPTVKVECVAGNHTSIFKQSWPASDVSASTIGMACGEAWERKVTGSVDYGKWASSNEDKQSRFEEGKPADPTGKMTEEDAKKWEAMKEEHGDKFKKASDLMGWQSFDLASAKFQSALDAFGYGEDADSWARGWTNLAKGLMVLASYFEGLLQVVSGLLVKAARSVAGSPQDATLRGYQFLDEAYKRLSDASRLAKSDNIEGAFRKLAETMDFLGKLGLESGQPDFARLVEKAGEIFRHHQGPLAKEAAAVKWDKNKAKQWMLRNISDYVDRMTGEVNETGLAEGAAQEFDIYGPPPDYEIPEELFDLSFNVGEVWERKQKHASEETSEDKQSRFEEGKPVPMDKVVENMSKEDAEKWKAEHAKNKGKFKKDAVDDPPLSDRRSIQISLDMLQEYFYEEKFKSAFTHYKYILEHDAFPPDLERLLLSFENDLEDLSHEGNYAGYGRYTPYDKVNRGIKEALQLAKRIKTAAAKPKPKFGPGDKVKDEGGHIWKIEQVGDYDDDLGQHRYRARPESGGKRLWINEKGRTLVKEASDVWQA